MSIFWPESNTFYHSSLVAAIYRAWHLQRLSDGQPEQYLVKMAEERWWEKVKKLAYKSTNDCRRILGEVASYGAYPSSIPSFQAGDWRTPRQRGAEMLINKAGLKDLRPLPMTLGEFYETKEIVDQWLYACRHSYRESLGLYVVELCLVEYQQGLPKLP